MAAKARNPRKTRNPDLIRGVGKFSRSKMYHKRGLWSLKAKNGGVFPRHDAKPAAETQPEKPPKFYPADDVKKPLVNKTSTLPINLQTITSFPFQTAMADTIADPIDLTPSFTSSYLMPSSSTQL